MAVDLDAILESIKTKVREYTTIEDAYVDPAISENTAFLKLVKVRGYNWHSPLMTKMTALRYTVKVPNMNVLNLIIYPDRKLDAPIFLFHLVIAANKAIYHLNLIRIVKDEADYNEKWIEPLKPILGSYEPFKQLAKFPDWMEPARHHSSIMGAESKARIDDITDCMMRYLDFYLQHLVNCEAVTDPVRLQTIADFHDELRNDIRTKDRAQKMTSGMIGKEKAKRLFYEVAT